MKFRSALVTLALSLVSVPPAGVASAQTTSGAAPYKEIPTVSLQAQIAVAAPPSRVWAYVTTGKNLVTWCPMWKNAANAKVSLTKVGDALDFTDQWGHGGRSVVTYVDKDKQIRIAHEPNDGSYMCQAKLVLTPQGSGTLVQYGEMYTDSSSPADLAATAGKMNAEMAQSLQALKTQIEKK